MSDMRYIKAVLIPLALALVTAWNEHRAAQNRERTDASYAVTAPVIKAMQKEQAELAARIDVLTKLLAEHITQHPVAGPRAQQRVAPGQVVTATKLKDTPTVMHVPRSLPASPDEAVKEMRQMTAF